MGHLVGDYARSVREARGLRRVDLARAMGLWRNQAKGVRRVATFEADGTGTAAFRDRLAAVLGLGAGRIAELRAEEARQYQAWLDEPVPMELTVRLMAALYVTRPVPPGLTRAAAIDWAVAQARSEGRFAMCLRVSRRERVWIERGGTSYWVDAVRPGTEHLPSMSMGGRPFRIVQRGPAVGGGGQGSTPAPE